MSPSENLRTRSFKTVVLPDIGAPATIMLRGSFKKSLSDMSSEQPLISRATLIFTEVSSRIAVTAPFCITAVPQMPTRQPPFSVIKPFTRSLWWLYTEYPHILVTISEISLPVITGRLSEQIKLILPPEVINAQPFLVTIDTGLSALRRISVISSQIFGGSFRKNALIRGGK